MLDALLEVVIPVFTVAAVGFVYAGKKPLPVGEITDLILHVTGACLVLDALSTADRLSLEAVRVPVSAVLVVVGALGLAAAARRVVAPLASLSLGAAALTTAFMNAGNLGLPLTRLALGEEGFRLGMLYFVTMSALMNSVGIGLMAGGNGVKVALRMPLLHATVVGLALNLLGVHLPRALAVPIHMLGQTVIPLMLLSLGGRLRSLVDGSTGDFPWAAIVTLSLLRLAGGLGLGLVVNGLLGNTGTTAQVVLLVSGLPPAVMSFAIVEKFGRDARDPAVVSGAIAVATAVSSVTLPFVIDLVRGS